MDIEENLVCPIGGEKFKAILAASGTSFGQYLDLKPYGPVAAPWPLAQCPSNGFVIYKGKFSDMELATLREFVASAQYQELKNTHTRYYLAAVLQRQLNARPSEVASSLLQATWEVSEARYPAYATQALQAYAALLKTESTDSKQWMTYQLVAGELERRLMQFEQAANRFSAIKDSASISAMSRKIIEFQLELISQRNATPQMIPSMEK